MLKAKSPFVALAAILLCLTGCKGRLPAPAPIAPPGSAQAADAEPYLAPPRPDGLSTGPQGLMLSGSGPARAKARLSTPAGAVITGNIDKHGRWIMPVGPITEPAIYGLSATGDDDGRRVQAEGYTLVTPGGQAALLRAGDGAVRVDRATAYGIRTLDFDRQGVAVLSAATPPNAAVVVRLDGRQLAQGRADAHGRYELSLTPTPPGAAHRVQVFGDGFNDAMTVQLTPAQPLVQGPMRSQLTEAGLRVDWMTPGGGVQSTILIH